MRTNRKTEEKKMSMNKNIARLAVTAGLTAALSFGGVMAPVTMAFADGTPTVAQSGNVMITESTYKDTTFKGIQIFKATVTQDMKDKAWNGGKTLSDIEWAGGENGSVKNAVIHAFDKVAADSKPTDLPTDNSAQAWAEFINNHASEVVDNNVNAGTVLDMIARALEGANIAEGQNGWQTSNNGAFNTLMTGYWLFVTKSVKTDSTNQNTDTFTSPIFTIVGGADVTVVPKKDVPKVTKAVKDDAANGTFGVDVFANPNMSADSRMDQFIEYQLAGTVASNINTYGTYKYTFTDELPKSMTPELKSDGTTPVVTVKIGDTKVAFGYTAKYENDKLTVDFTDLKSCKDEGGAAIKPNGNSNVTVEYKAKLDSTKIFENDEIKKEFDGLVGKAQENKVTLTYSNNPHGNGEGNTVIHPAYDYTYGIDVTKVGSDTVNDKNPTLSGVKFTLQEKNGKTIENKYIDAKGVKHNEGDVVQLTTDDDGKINVVGLDEGTYVLKEVEPAPGYNNSAASGVTFTISRTLNQAGGDVTPNATSAIVAGQDVVQADSAKAEVGKLSFTIVDQKGTGLPLTGLNGVTFTWIAGGAVLCIGVAHLIRSRKQAEESEQE